MLGFVCGWRNILILSGMVLAGQPAGPGLAWECHSPAQFHPHSIASSRYVSGGGYGPYSAGMSCLPTPFAHRHNDYFVKLAYGRTFGTCTTLDYATFELSKSVVRYPAFTVCGPAMGEVQVAMLGSYVFYYEGGVERAKRLDFQDGYEFAWLPKGKFTFPAGPMGMAPYLESGAGMSYVSETYRNSGSRWNWSLLAGFGMESALTDGTIFSLGLQWRHLSNGNMWGKGDELHNSNSGTDMIQALMTVLHRF